MSRMQRFDWRNRQSRRRPQKSSPNNSRHDRRLRLEPLEDRRLLAITVDTLTDELDGSIVDGDISLRDAIAAAAPAETIDFSVTGTINLDIALGQLSINQNQTIDGPGADQLTIDAGGNSRVLLINSGTVDISGLTLTGGNFGRGAAIRNEAAATTTLTDMLITGNTSTTGGGDGGGGLWNAGDLTVTSSTISGNVALSGGGGLFSNGTLTIIGSTISGNTASYVGGGIFINGGTLTVQHSTVTGNSTNAGGGIYHASGTTTLSHTIISGNTASFGNEIRRLSGTVNLNDYNLIGDDSGTTAQALAGGGVTAGATDILATSDGTNPTALASILDTTLADNGGPTLTHALVAGSPAIDNGNPAVASPPANDQRGVPFPRVVNIIDIGAIESLSNLVVDTLTDESDGDYSVGDLSLREAMELTNANLGADTVTFDAGLALGTINLDIALGQLEISDDVIVTGLGADQLTVDGGGNSRVLHITSGTVDISGLTFAHGDADGGGGLFNDLNATTTLSGVVIDSNTSSVSGVGGGGVLNLGDLTINESTVSSNEIFAGGGEGFGGGIMSLGGTLNIQDSTITGNFARVGGGVSLEYGATANIRHSTILNNLASGRGGGIRVRATASATLSHTIVSGNQGGFTSGWEISNGDTVNVDDYNLFGDSSKTTAEALLGVTPGTTDILTTSDELNIALGSILKHHACRQRWTDPNACPGRR